MAEALKVAPMRTSDNAGDRITSENFRKSSGVQRGVWSADYGQYYLTRTRNGAAGAARMPSWELPASTEGY
jgi:hypothetical protein